MARESRQDFGVGVERSRDRIAGRVCLVAWGGLHARLLDLDALATRCTSLQIRLEHGQKEFDCCWVDWKLGRERCWSESEPQKAWEESEEGQEGTKSSP